MARIAKNQSEIEHTIDPAVKIAVGPTETSEEQQPIEKTTWSFVKNVNPKETIKFKDGSTFVFPSQLFFTADRFLSEKIREIGNRYGIVENE